MNILPLDELKIHGVYDAGVPNQERIVLQANQVLDLGGYGLTVGHRFPNGNIFPLRDNMLWLGDGMVSAGDWVFIYTAHGQPQATPTPGGGKLISLYWGRNQTIFQNKELVPMLFKFSNVKTPVSSYSTPYGQIAGF